MSLSRLDGVRVLLAGDSPRPPDAREGRVLADLSRPVGALSPQRGGATPATALTGLIGPEHRARVLRAGFQYHIETPVQVRALIGVVAILALKE
jgi:CheY-like chemotaxis protein